MLGPGRAPPSGVLRVLTDFSAGFTTLGGAGTLGAALDLTFVVAIFFILPLQTGHAEQAFRALAQKQAELYNLWQ